MEYFNHGLLHVSINQQNLKHFNNFSEKTRLVISCKSLHEMTIVLFSGKVRKLAQNCCPRILEGRLVRLDHGGNFGIDLSSLWENDFIL